MKRLLPVFLSVVLVFFCQALVLNAGTPRTIEKTFAIGRGGTLELDLDAGGSLDISGWSKDEVAVTAVIGGKDAERVEVEFDDQQSHLKIYSFCKTKRNCRSGVRLTIKLPSKFGISMNSNGGAVKIDGIEGKMSGTTMGGALELTRIKGEVNLKTMGGPITVRDSEADGKVSTMGGDVLVQNVKGNLEGSTMGGKVSYKNVSRRSAEAGEVEETHVSTMEGDIDLDTEGKNVKAKTYGGDIDVTKGKEVNLSTMGGDINVGEAPAGANVSTMGGDITIRSAGGYVKAKTMGGDVQIDAIDGWVAATTMGGDVTATMIGDPRNGRRDVQLKSLGGDIHLIVPNGLSMRFEIDLAYTKGKEGRFDIESDFPMDIEKTTNWERKHGSQRKHIYGTGSIGGGEHLVKISTINGNIYIRKG
ncbi:MAG: hypothetical protein QME66_12495 [Candidatus Eisenbacteria bacterium]|nr:hypothetical protein [Candidatus Eisenbacteria bacterium]